MVASISHRLGPYYGLHTYACPCFGEGMGLGPNYSYIDGRSSSQLGALAFKIHLAKDSHQIVAVVLSRVPHDFLVHVSMTSDICVLHLEFVQNLSFDSL